MKQNVVERAIALFGTPSEFARQLSAVAGKEISRQGVHCWRVRGQFSPEIIPAVHKLTKIAYAELLQRERPQGGGETGKAARTRRG